jgi:hypothetical protein
MLFRRSRSARPASIVIRRFQPIRWRRAFAHLSVRFARRALKRSSEMSVRIAEVDLLLGRFGHRRIGGMGIILAFFPHALFRSTSRSLRPCMLPSQLRLGSARQSCVESEPCLTST